MSYANNRLLFHLFWTQNQNKSFDEFGTLYGYDEYFNGIKIKDLTLLEEYDDCVRICGNEFTSALSVFYFYSCSFDCFEEDELEMKPNLNKLNILDHISFEDNI